MVELIKILVIEDSVGDIKLIRRVFKSSQIKNELMIIEDGEEALNYLTDCKKSDLPDLILLDINLPKVNGLEILEYLKKDAIRKAIPVVILTTSSSDKDIQKSYDSHVNSYVIKPLDFRDFIKIVQKIEGFYLGVVKLPQ